MNPENPRLCNGSTADSGSACGGSNPPWGITKTRVFVMEKLSASPRPFGFHEAPSSIGQDMRFSILKEEFDSPRG